MESIKPGVLIISPFFAPNVGGVETHLTDLTQALSTQNYPTYVLTYSPLTTKEPYLPIEIQKNLTIWRFRWFGHNLFHQLERYPVLDFLYLTPYLLVRTLLWLSAHHTKIKVIHSHGFNAQFIGVVSSFIFRKRHITSIHAVYDHLGPMSQAIIRFFSIRTHHLLCLSQASQNQLLSWGIAQSKITLFKYWINLKLFKPTTPLPSTLTFLFIGRLIPKKGVRLFLKLSTHFPKYKFLMVGTGPMSEEVSDFSKTHSNFQFLGSQPNTSLPAIINQSSALCLPSLYAEGFGRVSLETLACGHPVIATNLGGIPESLDSTVSILLPPHLKSFIKVLKSPYITKQISNLSKNCRSFCLKNYSSTNLSQITRYFLAST
ncbi:MAG: glycosyltransferase family 4 protein [Candidatus Shapirobacteria bacterium]